MSFTNEEASTSAGNTIIASQFQNCTLNMNTGDVIHNSPKTEIIPSIMELKRVQQKFEEESFIIDVPESSHEHIQNIFPKMVEVPLADEDVVTTKEQYIPSDHNTQKHIKKTNTKEINLSDVVTKLFQSKLVNLIGLPGAGKSTLARRLTKRFCRESSRTCILVKFMNLNFKPRDRKLTLRELLIDHNYPELQEEDCKSAFKWITENEDNVLLILDGYDQADWFINEDAPFLNYSEPQHVWDLVSNLYLKKYLPKCHILFTSRPHAIKTLPKSLRKKFTVHLLDLSIDDMKILFFVFSGSKASELWDMLLAKAPQLVNLCRNPFFLQLVISVCISPNSNIITITTMTRLFSSVLANLNTSDSSVKINSSVVLPSLTELAFNATFANTVVMNENEVLRVGLKVSTVHHLVLSPKINNSKGLFEGKTPLFFVHQTIQECLTALYIHNHMSNKTFLQKLLKTNKLDFREFVDTKLFSSQWSMVRRFLYGITFDLHKNTGIQQQKKDLLKNKLIQEMESEPEKRDLIELCSCVRECADKDVTRAVAEVFPTKASMWGTPISNSDSHALSLVLRKVD